MVLKKLSGFHVHIILEFLVLLHDCCEENALKESKRTVQLTKLAR